MQCMLYLVLCTHCNWISDDCQRTIAVINVELLDLTLEISLVQNKNSP